MSSLLIGAGLIAAAGIAAASKKKTSADQDGGAAAPNDPFYFYDDQFQRYALLFNVPWRWLKAIAMNESSLGQNPLVKAGLVSTDGKSWGVMQLTLPTARDFATATSIADLNNPEISIKIAAIYIQKLCNIFSRDRRRVIMSYNQGQGATLAGKEYAAGYYDRFLRNLAVIARKQPGNDNEIAPGE